MFSTSGVEYTKVCGKVIAYQDRTTDAFCNDGRIRGANPTIDSNYVDGVSLTHGHTPRDHIWTFAAAIDESILRTNLCECSHFEGTAIPSPVFIGQDYFCDSGSRFFPDIRSFLLLIHCGMGMGVALIAPAVPSTTLHGSTRSCHPPLVTT